MILVFIIGLINVNTVKAECLSFIPYAHNTKFTHLPANKKFCVKNKSGTFYFHTSKLNSRLIFSHDDHQNNYFAFGDSQLLGIDWDETKKNTHDLEVIINNKKTSIFASPNNGPFQSIAQAEVVFKNKNFDKLKGIIFSFNFGNDIFRIQQKWHLENFVPLRTEELDTIMDKPFLYDLIILKGVLSGKYFSTNLPNNKQTFLQYKQLSNSNSYERIKLWLSKVKDFKIVNNKNIILLTYPPYWIYDEIGNIIYQDVYQDYIDLVSYLKTSQIFEKVYFGKLLSNKFLTEDKRHFKTGSVSFNEVIN